MGEAKRRKQLDPNYGKISDIKITEFSSFNIFDTETQLILSVVMGLSEIRVQ
ncbi:MAG: hypothetical protein QNJ68_10385 [Microcoleaceae cyanobacterium MO_207.B10]|nr:hypothetical protein [Microcoleaceae cyanobacterium MO_207.B10]